MSPSSDSSPSSEDPPTESDDLSLLSRANVAVVQLSPDGEIVTANDALVDLTGRSRARLLGSPLSEFLSAVPPSLERTLQRDAGSDGSVTLTLPVKNGDGSIVTCESRFEPVAGDDGDVAATIGTLYRQSESSTWTEDAPDAEREPSVGTAPAKAFIALADALSDGIIVLDTASEIQYANPAVERILGYTPDELVGGSKLSIIPEHLRQTHLDALNRYLETGERNIDWEYVELPGQHKDGYEVSLGISLNDFLFDGDRYFVGLFRDISPRKEAQQALREREQRLDRYKDYTDDVLNAIDDTFYVVDEAGEFQRWNKALSEVTGYADDDIASMNVLDLFDDDERSRVPDAIQEGFETDDGSIRIETALATADGDSIPYEFVGATLTDPDGTPVLAGIGRDITERKEQQRRVEESERRYRTLVENFPNGVVALYDADLRYTAVGGELLDELGFEQDDVIGMPVEDHYPEPLSSKVEPHFREALEGESNSFEVTYAGRRLSAYTLPIRDADADIFAGMLMIQDVTEREEIRRRLEESNERLEQFAYAASHDLQEPLRMVTSYLQLLEKRYGDDLDGDAEEFLAYAVDGAERMRDMIEGLLQYSRVDTQGDPFEPVDLDAVLEEVRTDLQVKIEETNADVGADELPYVSGDRGQLRQVFQNLLSNAIEYSGDEPPTVDVSAERDGRMWRLSVRDEGVGIDPDETDRIFRVFQRLHGRDEHAGTGLGLALCQRIVERHGGEIRVDSEPGEGSTFHFTLEAAAPPEDRS